MAPVTPVVTGGSIGVYSVSPSLPAGIALDTQTGMISGVPSAPTPSASYTVMGTNNTAHATTTLIVVVNAAPPAVAYSSPYYTVTQNIPVLSIPASSSGGQVVSWSIAPALPDGLVFSTTDGHISGTATAPSPSVTYTVTATNSAGSATATLAIAVLATAPLLDMGHKDSVLEMRTDGSHVLSVDVAGHWLLENYGSAATLAAGDGVCKANTCQANAGSFAFPPVDLAGGTVLVSSPSGLEIRSAADGHVMGTVAGQFWWYQLAADGSYVVTGNASTLQIWSTSGNQQFSRSGDYSKALVYAAPGEVRVALGPAGQNVIETVSVTTGAAAVSAAFQGQFRAWFQDGGRFLSSQGNAVWTYSSSAVQQDLTQMSVTDGLAGQGNWFWTLRNGELNIYQVGASSTPALTSQPYDVTTVAIPSGNTIGLFAYGTGQLTVIDLTGPSPVSTSYTTPIAYLESYAAAGAANWLVGNGSGVILDGVSVSGQARYLTHGAAWSIAGGTAYFAIATADGTIFCFDSTTNALIKTIAFRSSQLSISASGTVLAAAAETVDAQYSPDRTVNIYSLPGGGLLNSFPGTIDTDPTVQTVLSSSGTVLARLLSKVSTTTGCDSEALPVTGGAPLWCDNTLTFRSLQLSPDGSLVAAAVLPSTAAQPPATSSIYQNGKLTTVVPAKAIGWLDNQRLLANTYVVGGLSDDPQLVFNGAVIFDPLGNQITTSPIPELSSMQVVSSDSIYSPDVNSIISPSTGKATWASGNPISPTGSGVQLIGAVAGGQVVFDSGTFVLAQPY
jgi:hypothetical protein